MEHVEEIEMLYSIYRFTDPRDKAIIYIGLTNNPDRRYREHARENGLLYPLSQELAEEGLQLIFEILETTVGLKNAFKLEKTYIQQYQPLLNILNNADGRRMHAETYKFREDVAMAMETYHFTFEEALIWHHQFYSSEGDWHSWEIIKRAIIATQKKLQGKFNLTESEILEIALEATNFYNTWDELWDSLWASLLRKAGVEGE